MKDISVELKVGLAVITAALILIFGVVWIKEYRLGVKRYECRVLFPNIGSLYVGDPVRVLGVKKGEVDDIVLSGGEVLVKLSLTGDVKLKEDAEITVKNLGLMGERFVDISPGTSDKPLDLSNPARGYYDTGISEVMGMMGQVIIEMRELITVFQSAVGADQDKPLLVKIVEDMEKITNDLRELTENNKDKMGRSVDDLAVASSKLREFVEKNESKLGSVVDNLDKSSGTFSKASANIDSVSLEVKELVNDLKNGQGTLGRAMTDEALYDKLLKTTSNLDSLITDLKENPKKYIHFSIF